MRLSQSASVSSSNRGNGNRLGMRTRKKHKRLDAINEDVFNRNRRVRVEASEGLSKRECVRNDPELRRSSRVRRLPVILDSSPPPSKKKRKINKLGKTIDRGSVEKLKGKGKSESGATPLDGRDSEEEELSGWKLRLRSRDNSVSFNSKRSGVRTRGKRKLFVDREEDDGEGKTMNDDLDDETPCLGCEKLTAMKSETRGRVRTSIDCEDELHYDHSVDEVLGNGDYALREKDDGDGTPSTSGRSDRSGDMKEGVPDNLVEKENQVPMDTLILEEQNRKDMMKKSQQNDEPLTSRKLAEDAENHRCAVENVTHPADVVEDVGCSDVQKLPLVAAEETHAQVENASKMGNCSVASGGIPKSRVKEGRRCGLCGGGTDGKPPKRLANDSTGSDHEEYSGSSASEECNYDAWDGFGDELGWLGRLLGPINDRYGIAGIWVHQQCAVWSPEVYFAGLGCLKNVRAALCRGKALKCTHCGRPGATLGCRVDRCPRTYHLPCARASSCIFDHRKFLIACADHRYLFQPHGFQCLQHMKKLKAKKMKLELRKLSNDASRKDLEAEEKWLENCGEDEEFLRRETKRLQRDLLRIAPVYIGGSHSEGENLFGGWECVAGLQDVIQCMKEIVILPLLYPEFFENMGITPPRGVLLHGHPGTGKTLVVRALIGSCARGDKRIAYFARKGADCLGKYVGDAERQLRLLFQVAERSQPSIIFFDEIDGLAPVRTRQQDQTHSSVVSTLLALMDGLKSRGSVVVIGATNRPDAVDPALRRPGRFDREIYFPLPSLKDRAAVLALHTRKWPKPVAGHLLERVATTTVGFAGADLQALCAQAAVIALKRSCPWQKIMSTAGNNDVEGKRLQLPAFVVEERDWFEALSIAPPPCSRREAGMAANEVVSSPLHIHLIPCLLHPLLSLIISLYIDDRLWLPCRLINAGAAIRRFVVSAMEKKGLQSDRWWCYAKTMVQESDTKTELVRCLSLSGFVDGDDSFAGCDFSNDSYVDDTGCHPHSSDVNPSGGLRNLCYAPLKKAAYRVLIAGEHRSGQKHLASCLLHCFVGSVEMQKIDLATISQEGHGDVEQGISRILMKCANMRSCAFFMPRIDLWTIQSCSQCVLKDGESEESSLTYSQTVGEEHCSLPSACKLVEVTEPQDEVHITSQTWKSFVEQMGCICGSSSSIILATSELPCAKLPREVQQFFSNKPLTFEGSLDSEHAIPRFSVEVDGEFDHKILIHSSAIDLSRDIIQLFIQLIHRRNHASPDSSAPSKACYEAERDTSSHNTDLNSEEKFGTKEQLPEGVIKTPVPSSSRNLKGKSTLVLAISTFGYQILTCPYFAQLCWVTSKLKEGPTADIHGPWKGWPFNSCIARPCNSIQKETVSCNSNNIKGKDKFTLVRGLVAIGLSAYRGVYTSTTEVSLEVRKVLELLVEQISDRIQAGKDRCQFIRLLSQVAYLEDMVNNWAYSLRSLETEGQTTKLNPKLTGPQSPEKLHSQADNPIPVRGEPNAQDGSFQEQELVERGLEGLIAESSAPADLSMKSVDVGGHNWTELTNPNETSPKKAVPNHIAPGIYLAGEVANGKTGSPKEVVLASNLVTRTDFDVSATIDQSCIMISSEKNTTECEPLKSKPLEDHVVIVKEMPFRRQSSQLSCTKSLYEQSVGTCHSCKLDNAELCGSRALHDQSNTGSMVQNEISAEPRKHAVDAHFPDVNITCERSSDLSQASEAVCSYSCCNGCIYTLHQLLKKIVTREWELSGSRFTVEGVHDLVALLSTSLCSTVRNSFITGECTSSLSGERRTEAYREMKGCQCVRSENKFAAIMNCVYQRRKDASEEVSSYDYNLLGLNPRFIFRNGVLISADSDKQVSFHCKYDTLCLCSLIEMIVITNSL